MDLGQFLLRLQGSGAVAVARTLPPPAGDAEQVLADVDAAIRIDGPAGLPPFAPAAAKWAAERLYAACALFVHRDLGADAVQSELATPCPGDRQQPATHLAVDLTFRHLGELLALARGVATGDPLVVALRQLAQQWPLSSVGIAGLGPLAVDALDVIAADAGLRRLYVDRILRHDDATRVDDPRFARAVAAAVGEHREFARSVLAVHEALLRGDPRAGDPRAVR